MSTIVIGDGPGGLSAALFLAKNETPVTVFGTDDTAMHHAYLYNYLGIPEIAGSEFQTIARGQVEAVGGVIREERVASVAKSNGGFAVTTEDGETAEAQFLILTEGRSPDLAQSIGLESGDDGIATDRDGRTSIDGIYVVGRSTRPRRSQAIISAGHGAAAALDILSRLAGKDVQDWDTPPKDDAD